MLELTEKRLVSLLWILKNKGRKWNISELRRGAAELFGKDDTVHKQKTPFHIMDLALTYGPTFTFVKELEKNGYLVKDPKTAEYAVSRAADLVKLISLARPFAGLKKQEYYSPFGFAKTMGVIKGAKFPHSFTVFAGSELYAQYVKTEQVHVYVREADLEKWAKYLLSKNCLKAETGQANLYLIPTKQDVLFRNASNIKGYSVAPMPVLLSDLLGYGGLAEEQANFLMSAWLSRRA